MQALVLFGEILLALLLVLAVAAIRRMQDDPSEPESAEVSPGQ